MGCPLSVRKIYAMKRGPAGAWSVTGWCRHTANGSRHSLCIVRFIPAPQTSCAIRGSGQRRQASATSSSSLLDRSILRFRPTACSVYSRFLLAESHASFGLATVAMRLGDRPRETRGVRGWSVPARCERNADSARSCCACRLCSARWAGVGGGSGTVWNDRTVRDLGGHGVC